MEPAGGLTGACLEVRPAGAEACRICCGAFDEAFGVCWSCRRIARLLARPLRAVTPISLTTHGTGLYAALRQYKGRPNSVAERQQLRLAGLIAGFLERHAGCVAPEGYDLVTVVPSLQVPAEPHPLAATLRRIEAIEPSVVETLAPASAAIGRNTPDREAFDCERAVVEGRRVLLVDDTYTTGAHLHSASAALDGAGARTVALLVVARHQDSAWTPARRLLELSARAKPGWTLERCARCADAHPR